MTVRERRGRVEGGGEGPRFTRGCGCDEIGEGLAQRGEGRKEDVTGWSEGTGGCVVFFYLWADVDL